MLALFPSVQSYEPPNNDKCLNSTKLTVHEHIESTLAGATVDVILSDCRFHSSGKGVWYRIVGTGSTLVLSIRDNNEAFADISLSVYMGVESCDNLQCVSTIDMTSSSLAGGESSTSWESEVDVIYHIHLSSQYKNTENHSGSLTTTDHRLEIFSLNLYELIAPDNDSCADATNIATLDGGIIQATTENSTSDFLDGSPCIDETYESLASRGVWYRMKGNGTFLRATICSENTVETRISVYSGSGNCNALECVANGTYVRDSCDDVTWQAEIDAMYYLFVFSTDTKQGLFNLTMTEFISPLNMNCAGANAPMFPNNQVIHGSTIASVYDDEPECLSGGWKSPGLWYVVVGTGGTIRAETCSNITNFDTEISLYRGICDVNLYCLGGNDDSCNDVTSAIQWRSERGAFYHLKVYGHGPKSVGEFGLTFSSFLTTTNDNCLGATEISTGKSIAGSTLGATVDDDAPVCALDSHLFPGIWYKVQGHGKAITVSTCSSGTETSTSIAVYTGSCDSLLCITGGGYDYSCIEDELAATATWYATDGVDYYILVLSEDGFGGNIELHTQEFKSVVENDFCQTAAEVVVDGNDTIGSLDIATPGGFYPNATCEYTYDGTGVWYKVIGNGEVIRTSICSSSSSLSFDLSMSVFRGSSCVSLKCITVGSPVDSSDCVDSRWRSTAGEIYYILVQGIGDSSELGKFSLSIDSIRAPIVVPDN